MLIWAVLACYAVIGGCFGAYAWWDNQTDEFFPHADQPNPLIRAIFWPVLVFAGLCLFLWDACSWAGGAFKPRR